MQSATGRDGDFLRKRLKVKDGARKRESAGSARRQDKKTQS
jgi:hypothetical protein